MFEDSLIEQRIKTHRGAATVVSFLLQVVLVGIIVLIPLIFTQALPLNVQTVTELISPPLPPPPPPPPAAKAAPRTPQAQPKTTPVPVTERLTEPLRIPQKIAMIHESAAPEPVTAPSPAGVVGGVPGGVPGGKIGGVLGGVLKGVGNAIPNITMPKRIRVSQGISKGLLIHKVTPKYPPLAKTARVQGAVVLEAQIGEHGNVQSLQVIKGQPMLTAAAVNAVKQWKYRPYYLNGQPVDVDTTITVNFELNG